MNKERVQQVGFAGLIGAVAGAALTAHRGRVAAAGGALAGALGLGAAEAVARARQRPGEIPALWSRILASGARHLGALLQQLYDFLLFVPLWIETRMAAAAAQEAAEEAAEQAAERQHSSDMPARRRVETPA